GPPDAIEALSNEILGRFPGAVMTAGDANYLWQSVVGFRWVHANGTLMKVAITPAQVYPFVEYVRDQPGARGWVRAGWKVVYVWLRPAGSPAVAKWPGVMLRGEGALWLGSRRDFAVMREVKAALDLQGRFPSLEE